VKTRIELIAERITNVRYIHYNPDTDGEDSYFGFDFDGREIKLLESKLCIVGAPNAPEIIAKEYGWFLEFFFS